jgi:hypothetical protein
MTHTRSRRDFLQTSAALISSALGVSAFDFKKKTPRLAFSTLGCPTGRLPKLLSLPSSMGLKELRSAD